MPEVKENFFTPPILEPETIEPWYCVQCHAFIYNLKDGYPSEGAPEAKYWDATLHRLCSMCFSLLETVRNREYFRKIQEKKDEEYRRIMKNG